jgi:pyruvate formate lyase activating enzyme
MMGTVSRRRFLVGTGAAAVCGIGAAAGLSGHGWWETAPRSNPTLVAPESRVGPHEVEARYYTSFAGDGSLNCSACHDVTEDTLPVSYCHTPHSGSYIQCSLCPHRCVIAAGARGICRVRENRDGRLYSLVYGNPCAVHVDPIEKKPFFHFLPSAAAFSIATAGCNLRCLYCQNWNISQMTPEETENADLPPEDVVGYARQAGAPVIAYTYSEPTAFFEYVTACAKLGREAGLYSAVISAGFIELEPLRELCQVVDAIKIDLKGYDAGFYRKVCSAELAPVLRAIETIFRSGVHLEIVNLVVPGLNDNPDQLRGLARWVAKELSPDVPLHFSRFQPQYKLANLPPTPVESLDQARQIAGEEGVRFVYVGNVPGHPGNSTYCPVCGRAIIVREGFTVTEYHLTGGNCAYCGASIPGVWWPGEPAEKAPVQVRPGPSDQ